MEHTNCYRYLKDRTFLGIESGLNTDSEKDDRHTRWLVKDAVREISLLGKRYCNDQEMIFQSLIGYIFIQRDSLVFRSAEDPEWYDKASKEGLECENLYAGIFI